MNLIQLRSLIKSKRAELEELETALKVLSAYGPAEPAPKVLRAKPVRQGRKPLRRRFPRICEECKQPFKGKQERTKYCSHRCRGAVWNRANPNRNRPAEPKKPKPAVLVAGDPLRPGASH